MAQNLASAGFFYILFVKWAAIRVLPHTDRQVLMSMVTSNLCPCCYEQQHEPTKEDAYDLKYQSCER